MNDALALLSVAADAYAEDERGPALPALMEQLYSAGVRVWVDELVPVTVHVAQESSWLPSEPRVVLASSRPTSDVITEVRQEREPDVDPAVDGRADLSMTHSGYTSSLLHHTTRVPSSRVRVLP